MAVGWASDDAVNKQIESTICDAIEQVRSRINPGQESAEFCQQCGEPIPKARRKVLPGVQFCISCQTEKDKEQKITSLYNRRGSKDSQLR